MRVNITFVMARLLPYHDGVARPTGPNARRRPGLAVRNWCGGSTFAGGVDVPADDGDIGATFHAGVAVGRALDGDDVDGSAGVATAAAAGGRCHTTAAAIASP